MSNTASAIDALIEAIAERVVQKQRAAAANDSTPKFYDARSAPCGPRAFLDAARQGAFPSFRRGRRVLARCDAVDAWIEAAPRQVKAPPVVSAAELEDEALLERAGIRRRGGR